MQVSVHTAGGKREKKHTKKTNKIHESRNMGGGGNVRYSFDDYWPTTVIKTRRGRGMVKSVENATLPRVHLDFSAIYPFTVFSLRNINWKKIKIN